MVTVVLALVIGTALPRIDAHIDDELPPWLRDLLFDGGPDAARSVLSSISSSLITVTSLTFSLTVVALQLGSSQFSPRLLRMFTRDLFVQATLALFLATFTYALTVSRSVRSTATDGSGGFVPRVSTTVGYVLAIISVVGLVLFLAHLARQLRVETMLRNVRRDASDTARRVLGDEPDGTVPPFPPGDGGVAVLAPASGFLVDVDERELVRAAAGAEVVVRIDVAAGSFVIAGTPIATVWASGGVAVPDDLLAAVPDALSIGFERTGGSDVEYGLRQLTDVAVKALSPGINDPTTAIHALGHSAALLCELAERPLGPRVLVDESDQPRVVLTGVSFDGLVDVAMSQPRRYGASDPAVLERLYQLLRELAWSAHPRHRAVVEAQLERLDRTAHEQDFDSTERSALARRGALVRGALDGRW